MIHAQVDPTRDIEAFVNRFWKNGTAKVAGGHGSTQLPAPACSHAHITHAQAPTHTTTSALTIHTLDFLTAHVFGDEAVETVLQAMEKAYQQQGPTTKRHSLQVTTAG